MQPNHDGQIPTYKYELYDSDEDRSISSIESLISDDEELKLLSESSDRFQQTMLWWYWWEPADDMVEDHPRKKRCHRKPKGVVFYTDEEGVRRVLPPTMSLWYNMYIDHPYLECDRFHKKFRRRFRMPYQQYLELTEMIKISDLFDRWKGNDASGKPSAPIELLVLTALRYLGRGWTFDDLSESTAISEDVIRVFLHQFIKFGSTTLFESFVKSPSTVQEAERESHEFEMAGLPGAIGSMDATHILHERVKYRLRQSHLGFKLTATARTYNLVVNHRRRILATTEGHPARWNDKTLVRFDKFATSLHKGSPLDYFRFELYDFDEEGKVIKRKYRGAWLLVDNGYLRWSTTIPPFKATTSRKEIRFSEWLESMRKDVECTFGILKGRWRVLKTGIRLHGLEEADMIWKTCCALHNWLLEVDGLDAQWSDGVPSDWENELGEHDIEDIQQIRAIERLLNPGEARDYDTSGHGAGHDRIPDDEQSDQRNNEEEDGMYSIVEEPNDDRNGFILVRQMTFETFRSKLVTHFDIAFKRREIKWPKRNRQVQPTV